MKLLDKGVLMQLGAYVLRRATLIATVLVWLGPLGSSSEAGFRYRHSTYSFHAHPRGRAYGVGHGRLRPYRRHRYDYRGDVYSRYYGWGYWPTWGLWEWGWAYRPFLGLHFSRTRVPQVEGGATDYSYRNGAVQTKVRPRQAEVYVDGHYDGIVDDFDGPFQRLYLPPGEHEIVFSLEGYKVYRQALSIHPGRTIKIHHEMERLGPGETTPAPPERGRGALETRGRSESTERSERMWRDDEARAPRPPEADSRQHRSVPGPSRFGKLALRVQPAEAQVFIDGQLWGTAEGLEELVVHVPVGLHRIEIRLEGMEPFATEVEIREEQTTPLNVNLTGPRP